MKVIAEDREIVYSNACGCSSADGELTSNFTAEEERAMFQKWYNKTYIEPEAVNKKYITSPFLRTDGVKDAATSKAYKKAGKEYEAQKVKENSPLGIGKVEPNPNVTVDETKKGMMDTVADLFKKDDTNPLVSSTKTKTPEEEKADKKKKMIKIALIAGGAIALTTIVILIARRKK